jgi:hypothetical protein
MKNREINSSNVYFKDSRVIRATNDGMQLLGQFLLSQVGIDKADFYEKWLQEKVDDAINAGPYFIEKVGNDFYLDHLENDNVAPFQTTKENMREIIKHWHGWCSSDSVSACSIGGDDVSISRSPDGHNFEFNEHKIH